MILLLCLPINKIHRKTEEVQEHFAEYSTIRFCIFRWLKTAAKRLLFQLFLNENTSWTENSTAEAIVRMSWHQVSQDSIKGRINAPLSHNSVTHHITFFLQEHFWIECYCTESDFRSKKLKGHLVLSEVTWKFSLYNTAYSIFSSLVFKY